ncbi:hypothetical protein G7Y89_g8491 [Cudoniella acicularis]|uniref:Tyrosinase copper-binding domain-containing protein n=1 Tax=Cudoniella acicularis TaxID=354080 RepID=A0A8H4W3I3_9HELO|nr:hypothetical protein G7Y89_g8491 [Cudoniella acicularis]
MAKTNIGDFQTFMQNGGSNGFGIHGAGHFIIAGDPGGDFYMSPGDPGFYLHHGQIDRLWFIWQGQDLKTRQNVISGTTTMGNNPPSANATLDFKIDVGHLRRSIYRRHRDEMGIEWIGWSGILKHGDARVKYEVRLTIGTPGLNALFASFQLPGFLGLFLKRSLNETCGLKLQLQPLHTLVVTEVYLAQLGSDGDNLFGIVACLLSLLGKGANPLQKAHISPTALLSGDDSQECTHSELDPLELAQRVPRELISKWSEERLIGWKIFCAVLRLSQNAWSPTVPEPTRSTSKDKFRSIYSAFVEGEEGDTPEGGFPVVNVDMEDEISDKNETSDADSDSDEGVPAYCPDHDEATYQKKFFGKNKTLATLWAAVQTELLTYRRLTEGDPWISKNFDMASVLESLENGDTLSIGIVSKGMMNPFCNCGTFRESDDPVCVRVEEACTDYFSNLEDWSRSTFLSTPTQRAEEW